VAIDVPPDLVMSTDRPKLAQALGNLIDNAAKFSPRGTPIHIHAEVASSSVVISVRDHGRGVPDEALPDIFLPFYRVGDARDRSSGGSGLGLSITDRAVRLHGGTVSAANQANGGLCVEIRLPLQAQNS